MKGVSHMSKLTTDTKTAHKKIISLTERPSYIKGLIYADAGKGKSWLAATAPKPLILLGEADVTIATLKALQKTKGIVPDIWEINSLDDIAEAYEFLCSGNHDYETVVIDGLTDINSRIKRAAVEHAVSKRDTHDPDILEQSDWNRVGEKMRNLVRSFRDLPMHVIMTALVMDIRSEMMYAPFVQPKNLALELPAYFNFVALLDADTDADGVVTRRLYVQPSDRYVSKNPSGALDPIEYNPDLGVLFPKILAAI